MKPPYPRLKNRRIDPPGGFVFRDEDTGMWSQSLMNLDDLVLKARQHREANQLPVPEDFAKQVEAFICYRIDPSMVEGMSADRKISERQLNLITVNKLTQNFMSSWSKNGHHYVEQNEADGRATLCANCTYNKKYCLSCHALDQWCRSWTGNKRTKLDKEMGICQCDGIILLASLHVQMNYKQDAGYPESCWKIGETK